MIQSLVLMEKKMRILSACAPMLALAIGVAFAAPASALAAYGVQWAGLVRHPALYAASLGLAFLACVINHNHQHHPTFVPRGLNRAFGALISLAMGIPATTIVAMHNYNHHVHNNPDLRETRSKGSGLKGHAKGSRFRARLKAQEINLRFLFNQSAHYSNS